MTTSMVVIALLMLVGFSSATTKTVTISSNAKWVNTGIDLKKGDELKITAEGSWTPAKNAVGPFDANGSPDPWPDHFLNTKDIGTSGATKVPGYAALVAYIGDERPLVIGTYTKNLTPFYREQTKKVLFVGKHFDKQVPWSGHLWLNFNDAAYSGNVADNEGSVTATIEVMPQEPASTEVMPQEPASTNYLLETDHPCANNYHHTWTISTPPGTTQMRIHFAKLELGSDDYLHLEQNSGNLKDFSKNDNGQDFWTDWYGVNSMDVVFSTTTYSKAGWGFKIDGLETRNNNGIQSTPT